ncbi:hypothetical protein Vadar_013397 [Vaccinium darrowii]|nr:hypothetical protein Vadar_013397 [Vaccinium darrowii]
MGSSKDLRTRKPDERSSAKKGGPLEKYQQFTPLVAMTKQILDDLHEDPDLKWSRKLRSDPSKRSKDKWCRFHRHHGHTTDDCIDLKQQIEGLIQRGRLRRFVKNQKPPRKQERPKNDQNKEQIQNIPIGEIVVVHGGPGVVGDSNRARKAHLRKLRSEEPAEVRKSRRGESVDVHDEDKLVQGEPVEDFVEAELDPGRPE